MCVQCVARVTDRGTYPLLHFYTCLLTAQVDCKISVRVCVRYITHTHFCPVLRRQHKRLFPILLSQLFPSFPRFPSSLSPVVVSSSSSSCSRRLFRKLVRSTCRAAAAAATLCPTTVCFVMLIKSHFAAVCLLLPSQHSILCTPVVSSFLLL